MALVKYSYPIREFFAQYPAFHYDSSQSAHDQFAALRMRMRWKRDDPAQEDAFQQFRGALVQQFNYNYGTDADDLGAWQRLCGVLGITPVPDTLKEAREVSINSTQSRRLGGSRGQALD